MRKLSAEIRPELLAELRLLAAAEGRRLDEILDEALTAWVVKRREEAPELTGPAGASDTRRRKLHEELANWANISRL